MATLKFEKWFPGPEYATARAIIRAHVKRHANECRHEIQRTIGRLNEDIVKTLADMTRLRDVAADYFSVFPALSKQCPCSICEMGAHRMTKQQAIRLLKKRDLETRDDLLMALKAQGYPNAKHYFRHHSFGLLIIELASLTQDLVLRGAALALTEKGDRDKLGWAQKRNEDAKRRYREKRAKVAFGNALTVAK